MHNLVKRLEKRGWDQKDISKAVGIIQNAKQNKTKENLFLEKRVYWIMLVLIITANFAIAVALMPILVALRGFALYFILIILGIVFGLLFELVIRGMEHLEQRHHLALAIIIPGAAISNMFLITGISNKLSPAFGTRNFHEPALVGLIYAASFVLPYIIYRFVLKRGYYSG